MACTSPLYAWKTGLTTDNGKPLFYVTHHKGAPHVWEVNKRYHLSPKEGPFMSLYSPFADRITGQLKEWCCVPCGKCEACKLANSRMWSERCMIEAKQYDHNAFITLTYGEYCPVEPTKEAFADFMKRLRLELGPGIRFFACGEFGEKTHRPHYHAILFNCDFPDKELLSDKDGVKTYTSKILRACWPYGIHLIGEVTPESCAYVARYCMKKTPGEESWINMSRRPGIGCDWFQEHLDDIYPTWKVYVPGSQARSNPPAYFVKLCDKLGLDTTIPKERNRVNAERAADTEMARLHLPDEEAYRAHKREEFKKKAKRLAIRRKL